MTGQEVYDILVARGVTRLYHANSVKTSISLLKLGGLASRQLVEQSKLPQTNQITDDLDRKFGIWGDVFVDMVDIHDRGHDRNKYGPVMFVMGAKFLLSLPVTSRVLVTRSNPSKWCDTLSDAERYFLNVDELTKGLDVGDFDQMLVIRTYNGLVPFQNYLQNIVLDEPRLVNGTSPDFDTATSALASAAGAGSVQTNITRRSCSQCKCVTSYAQPGTRIPWFYSI